MGTIELRKDNMGMIYCDITDVLDEYMLDDFKSLDFNNYICRGQFRRDLGLYTLLIRYPGATRGCIYVDPNTHVITKIEIYNDGYHTDDIYKEGVHEVLKQFIGSKIS